MMTMRDSGSLQFDRISVNEQDLQRPASPCGRRCGQVRRPSPRGSRCRAPSNQNGEAQRSSGGIDQLTTADRLLRKQAAKPRSQGRSGTTAVRKRGLDGAPSLNTLPHKPSSAIPEIPRASRDPWAVQSTTRRHAISLLVVDRQNIAQGRKYCRVTIVAGINSS